MRHSASATANDPADAIRLNGRHVTTLKPAQRGIGYVPQDRALSQTMPVREHLAFALVIDRLLPP